MQQRLLAVSIDITNQYQAQVSLIQQLNHANLVIQISGVISQRANVSEYSKFTAKAIGKAFHASHCLIYTYESYHPERLSLVAQYSDHPDALELNREILIADNVTAQMLIKQNRALISDCNTLEQTLSSIQAFSPDASAKSVLAVRTAYLGIANGVIELYQCDRSRHWTQAEVVLLEDIAIHMGAAHVNAEFLASEEHNRRLLDEQLKMLTDEIRERQLIEQKLLEKEAENQSILNAYPDLLLRFNRQGGSLKVLSPLDKYKGQVSPISNNLSDTLPSDQVQTQLTATEKALATGNVQIYEQTLIYQGKILNEEVRVSPCGQDTVLAIIRDISERKRIEGSLADTLRELSLLKKALDQSTILAVTDPDGMITDVNDRFCEISKYSRSELIGQPHSIINSGYHSSAFFKTLWNTISTGKIWRGEICNRAKDGTQYWVKTIIVPFINESGQIYQ